MIVLDASVVVELLTNGATADSIRNDLSGRRIEADRQVQFSRGDRRVPAERYPHTPLLERIWELRHNFTAYDATYIALAEAMNATLYTSDEKLCKGHRARVVLFTS
jgi:predicted nucleic acid-binding protein